VKIWIDLSNSPHPLLFAPVARRLGQSGHEVLTTARDNAQTVELAQQRWPKVEVIGGQSPHGRARKVASIGRRVAALRNWASAYRPDVALSHNSYAQIVAARSLGLPAVTAMDFEHQPANHVAFRLATSVLVPAALPLQAVRSQGATADKVVRYAGLKEELYIGDFEPDPAILGKLGIEPRPEVVVVARTSPSGAAYHQFANPLFAEALRIVCSQENVVAVALARHADQRAALARLGLRNCITPARAVDSRSLIYAADLMIGAGGTMTREAALIGIPTWSVFAGKTPAVDLWLARKGLLTHMTEAGQLTRAVPRPKSPRTPSDLRESGAEIERAIAEATLAACQQADHPREA
jgi:uncharacterized protein